MATNLFDINNVALEDEHGDIFLAKGATVPSDTASGYAKGCIFVDIDASAAQVFYVNEGSNTSCDFNAINPSAGSATAYDDIGNPDANGTIAFAGYTNTWTSTLDNGSVFTISNTDADLAADTHLVDLKFADDGDSNGIFLRCLDNSGADLKFSIGADGATTIAGTASGTVSLQDVSSNTIYSWSLSSLPAGSKIYFTTFSGSLDMSSATLAADATVEGYFTVSCCCWNDNSVVRLRPLGWLRWLQSQLITQ